ncbi:hypothetical protein FB451DRAFT_1570989 [Mycena latifolia]|nr:hypothetical protein FB451DRAFT_1570989 [Mycena latifolia]
MCPELPTELWLQILAHIPRRTLSSVAGVSHLLQALSSPLRFAKFPFHPGIYAENATAGTRLQRELARLAFWSSAPIAPLVRTCVIALYRGPIDPPSPLVAALFDAVSMFSNLRVFTFNCPALLFELPALRLGALQYLQKVHIHGAQLRRRTALADSTPLKVAHFVYTDMHQRAGDGPSALSMLDPRALRTLALASDRALYGDGPGRFVGPENFLDDPDAMGACHALHTLRLSVVHTSFVSIHAAVTPFPALRTLHVEVQNKIRMDPSSPLPTAMAPDLQAYRGPAALLPLVLHGTQPARLALTSGRAAEVCNALRGAGPECAASLTSLELRLALHADVLDSAVLHELLALCPRLAQLALEVSSDGGREIETQTLCARLADALRLPRTLETVAFRWRLQGARVPEFAEVEALLRTAVPGLKAVIFYGGARQFEGTGMEFNALDA